jgi:hypothetical protein
LALGARLVARLARAAEPVLDAEWIGAVRRTGRELGIRRPVSLLRTRNAIVPVTWGIVYPCILIPDEAMTWTPDRRTAVLVHELAHVRRMDVATQLGVHLACAVHWFNPLVWLAAHRVRIERERACDDVVVSHGIRSSTYAGELLAMARALRPVEPAGFVALGMAHQSGLEGRLVSILALRPRQSPLGRAARAVGPVLVSLVLVPIALARPVLEPRPSSASRAPLGGIPVIREGRSGSAAPAAIGAVSDVARSVGTATSVPSDAFPLVATSALPRPAFQLTLSGAPQSGALAPQDTGAQAAPGAMRRSLRNLVIAQEAYFAGHHAYAADLATLTPYRPEPGVSVLLAWAGTWAGTSGWRGAVRAQGSQGSCVMSVWIQHTGDRPATDGDFLLGKTTGEEGEPAVMATANRQRRGERQTC